MAWGLIGLDEKDHYKGEAVNGGLNPQGTDVEWDSGDRLKHAWAWMWGQGYKFNKDAVLKGAETAQTNTINNDPTLGNTNISISQYTPGVEPITRRPGETLQQTRGRAGAQLAVGQRISQAKANNPGIDLSGVQTVSDVDSAVSGFVKSEKDAATKKADDRIALEDRRLYEEKKDRHNLRVMDLEGRIATERSRLAADERQSKRDHEATLRGYDNQLASFNLENARLMQQEENRRADRKEKALYTLIASLSNLGASFSI
jgi:hypothetical protein